MEWVKCHTGGAGESATTAMEDTGTLRSLTFLAKAGRADPEARAGPADRKQFRHAAARPHRGGESRADEAREARVHTESHDRRRGFCRSDAGEHGHHTLAIHT